MPISLQLNGMELQGGALLGGEILELDVKLYAYAPFLHAGQVGVCQSSYVIDAQHFEDVLYSDAYLHIWHCSKIVVFIVFIREFEQLAGVQRVGAVLGTQVPEHSTE